MLKAILFDLGDTLFDFEPINRSQVFQTLIVGWLRLSKLPLKEIGGEGNRKYVICNFVYYFRHSRSESTQHLAFS